MNAAPSAPSSFITVEPTRILDTRTNVGLVSPPASDTSEKLQVTGIVPTQPPGGVASVNAEVVPTGATAVVLNATVVRPTTSGFLSIRPGDATGSPATSNINWAAGGPNIANSVIVQLPASGQIDIFVSGTVTEVLIDVAGYTSDARLDDLQAEIDAVEATNATQQIEIDAKANSADVYTKTEIDVRPFNHLVGGALVSSSATTSREFGDVTVAKLGTGLYEVTAPGITPASCALSIQVTPLNVANDATARFVSAGHQTNSPCRVRVHATDMMGTAVDSWFQFTLFQGGDGVTAIAAPGFNNAEACMENTAQSCD